MEAEVIGRGFDSAVMVLVSIGGWRGGKSQLKTTEVAAWCSDLKLGVAGLEEVASSRTLGRQRR